MDLLIDVVGQIGPVLAGVVTVPVVQGIKKASRWVDNRHPIVKQSLALLIAATFAQLGGAADAVVPGEVSMFSGNGLEGAIAAAVAFAVHAGQKAHENE